MDSAGDKLTAKDWTDGQLSLSAGSLCSVRFRSSSVLSSSGSPLSSSGPLPSCLVQALLCPVQVLFRPVWFRSSSVQFRSSSVLSGSGPPLSGSGPPLSCPGCPDIFSCPILQFPCSIVSCSHCLVLFLLVLLCSVLSRAFSGCPF